MSVEAFFLPVPGGQRLCLFHPAQEPNGGAPRGMLVYVHPFAEEMNKSRRMVALQARALARAGFAVLQVDLLGCGDSSGDFGDATWAGWVSDVVLACQCLRERVTAGGAPTQEVPLWLWGLRLGCLLAVDAARTLAQPCNFLFWAPALAGKPLLQQFLRLKAAASMGGGNAKAVMEALRGDLARGETVEVAGYRLSAALCSGMEGASLSPPAAVGQVVWLELSTRADAAFSPVTAQSQAGWAQAGHGLHTQIVNGPSFWQTTEIEDAPALLDATTAALLGAVAT